MKTVVHLLRHGEVYNPSGVLYGRRSGYHLSDLGKQMAQRVADTVGDRDITHVVSSPLERAQETAAPLAVARGVDLATDSRVIESTNVFEGETFGVGDGVLRQPRAWRHLWNPFRPSWGEPYKEIAARMMAAVFDARDAAEGHEAVVVSHQLPIWITRLHVENRSFLHDPRRRQCTLCSLTSLTFEDHKLTTVRYSEPAADLLPLKDRKAPFSAGGAPADEKPPAAGA
ncbi:histidine phosphatase family protein [Nocardioides sp. WL0053]|uniref:Histidine phosphatase family protein n=1 Tax=Nocardioides jiangsuensis TaxID=2866161 RepID=A0ABS7RHN5_9ACTN|nr:histidine phosphatase family protein [Nocardioides jiangsuensis]MBY9074550.1 histidine phosphatase family protein [Nocardioides jiangsuensis]